MKGDTRWREAERRFGAWLNGLSDETREAVLKSPASAAAAMVAAAEGKGQSDISEAVIVALLAESEQRLNDLLKLERLRPIEIHVDKVSLADPDNLSEPAAGDEVRRG